MGAAELTGSVREMWDLAVSLQTASDAEQIVQAKRTRENHARREAVLKRFANELAIVMGSMVTSINKRAASLGISSEPVTVDRSKLDS